jgi:hypothetical protein
LHEKYGEASLPRRSAGNSRNMALSNALVFSARMSQQP